MYEAQVVHHIPGRMRIKLPFLKGASTQSQQLNELLSPIEGLRQADFNPVTGSLLLQYDPEEDENFLKQVTEQVQNVMGLSLLLTTSNGHPATEEGAVRHAKPFIGDTKLSHEITKFFQDINREVNDASDGAFDLKSLIPIGLGVYAVFKVSSGMTTPLWITLGIFSFTSFIILNSSSLNLLDDDKRLANNRHQPSR
jgi:Heavy metal associated domain 2